MGAVRHIPRRTGSNAPAGAERRAWELRLARYREHARDPGERDALFEHFLPLARSLAARYRHTSESFDDLLQVASLGLLHAIDRYDSTRGCAFSSFAVPTILGELRRHLRDHTWSIRVPRELQELGRRLGPATDELTRTLARPPSVPELAEHLGATEEHVLDARQASAAHSPASLDQPVSGGDGTLGDLLGAEDRALATVEDAMLLDRYLARLPARSRQVLRLRYDADLKQREIAAQLGISQMHASRLIRQALEQLHTVVAADNGR